MQVVRLMRRYRGLTLVALAMQVGIPARTLVEFEYGLRPLDGDILARLADALGVPMAALSRSLPLARTAAASNNRSGVWQQAGPPLMAALIGASLLTPTRPSGSSAPGEFPAILGRPNPVSAAAPPTPPLPPAFVAIVERLTRTTTPDPTATPSRSFWLADDGPHGCPIGPVSGRIVITQGYNEGSHTPTAVWGGIDLAVDEDGDGNAEPHTTRGVQVLATHEGVAHVFLSSWPAGNYVRIDSPQGWRTAYAHLETVAVQQGQTVGAGMVLGTVGSTGLASGPHLHYETWRGTENIDPTNLVGCE